MSAAPVSSANDGSAAAGATSSSTSSSTTPTTSSASSSTSSSTSSSFIPKGYQGFGSFHSDNVEELIRISATSYTPPPRGVDCSDLLADPLLSLPSALGEEARRCFFLDPSWTFVNHGAFGGASRLAMKASQRWAEHCEAQPLLFIDRELFPLMCYSIRRLASHLSTPTHTIPPECVALVPNATYALTSVIASSPVTPGSSVYALDVGYGSVKKMLSSAASNHGARLVVGAVPLPCSREELIAAAVSQVPSDCSLAVIDHVTSNTGIVLPIREIVAGIRSSAPNCRIIVDGAHGLASQEVGEALLPGPGAPDIYISNCHKWLCSAKGLGMLYAAPHISETLRAAVISHGSGSGFTSEFVWDGARDYSMAVSLPTLLDWWEQLPGGGLVKAREYCRSLLKEAVALLTSAWGTESHMPVDVYSHMACVQLPPSCLPAGAVVVVPAAEGAGAEGALQYRCTSTHGKMLQDALHYGFRIECPVKTLPGPRVAAAAAGGAGGAGGSSNNRSYVRISAMVNNTIEDYKRLADAVLAIKWAEDGTLLLPASEKK